VTKIQIVPLGGQHDRRLFESTSPELDRYFREQVSQDVRRMVAACYVAVEVDSGAVVGFYTLSAGSIPLDDLPPPTLKKLPRYKAVPVARIGRLAVQRTFQGQKIGAALLWDAIRRALYSPLAAFAVVVDAKNDQAVAFYRHHGFLAFEADPRQLFLPLASVKEALED
jgi:ribosomal protein S18 acetylase RimI-like enzyme